MIIPASSAHRLPLNRKERFYTGTVLPMIVAADSFAHLRRFLVLCGVPADVGLEGLQFSTEYSLVESVRTTEERALFAPLPQEKDTPDLVLAGRGWLLVVEAKMFDQPSPRGLAQQLRAQGRIVECMTRGLHIPAPLVRHVALLPAAYQVDVDLGVPLVRWEQVLESYRDIGPAYWIGVLDEALGRHAELVSPPRNFSRNADGHLTGSEIARAFRAGTLAYGWMGREGGLTGAPLGQELESGEWRTHLYQVAIADPANRNWFAIAEFVGLLEQRTTR
ncbi:hypothetical protein [Actinomycetospora atypica]|uniref:Uncharacterized protein n=1 Tax=Actinomycetospora atypica TaxID=1290095 RepID=A0ABV9YHR5_9PSEU